MKLYTKIINEETKECLIINQEIAKQQGLESMNVDFAYNGKCYLLGFAPQKPLEELQAEKIAKLKENCSNYILSVYPIYKQLNIINPLNDYSNEDKLAMNEFIDNQRQICSSKEEEINNSTLETINNIAINFGD